MSKGSVIRTTFGNANGFSQELTHKLSQRDCFNTNPFWLDISAAKLGDADGT